MLSQDASRALREAFSIAPDNAKVKDVLVNIQELEASQPLLVLCQNFAKKKDDAAGKEAQWYLSSVPTDLSLDVASQCFEIVLKAEGSDAHVRDDLIASLLHYSPAVRRHLATQLQGSTQSSVFAEIFEIGDGAANGITVVTLDSKVWPSETIRLNSLRDVFQLFLAKFLQSGHDNDGRALKGIARHLAADGANLHTFIDDETFEAILYCLDYRLPRDVRTQATVATAKYLEVAKETAEECLVKFIKSRTAKHSSEDLVKAFSVAAAVFPIATQIIVPLFLTEGFLASLVPMLDKKSRPIKVEKAALDMLSAACIDKRCREAIASYCLEWMHHVMDDEEDERHGQAAVILAKVQNLPNTPPQTPGTGHFSRDGTGSPGSSPPHTRSRGSSKNIADVVPTLKNMLIKGSEMDKRTAIEGLAYASMQPMAKDEITRDPALLKELLQTPGKDSLAPTTAFGSLTLIDNLTRYLPNLSEEQKRMSELKAYANSSRPSALQPHYFDQDEQVTARCKWLLDSKVIPYLVSLRASFVTSSLSPNSLGLYARILLSLSRTASFRGTLAQQGAIPLILNLYSNPILEPQVKPTLAHTLARILISVNPELLPKHSTSSSIAPLITLLTPQDPDDNSPRDLLPTFEALLALTNLASDPSLPTAKSLVRDALPQIEDHMLSSNTLLQRAASELICNLVASPEGLEKFADGSPSASRRLHVLLALSDAEDVATRRAAGGALAGVTDFESAVKAVLERERGVELLLRMCGDEDPGVVHRGVTAVRNVVCVEGLGSSGSNVAERARQSVRDAGGVEVLRGVLQGSRNKPVVETVCEALKVLCGAEALKTSSA
ncbi:MAG: hypothetical protein LQ340_001666 [Diploschistes diacapsis]|nr:MAG: hypothetical protein LQ340_001666 [Diploschistes diacapsis]